jgi:8-oxo-dGTP diphosphatase
MGIRKRRRGTAIVETSNGILLTAGPSKWFILPGGEARPNETRTNAAIRELKEETGLIAKQSKFLFRHLGKVNETHHFQDHHTVVLIKAEGNPKPNMRDVWYVNYYSPNSQPKMSQTTKEIINRYESYKTVNSNPFKSFLKSVVKLLK